MHYKSPAFFFFFNVKTHRGQIYQISYEMCNVSLAYVQFVIFYWQFIYHKIQFVVYLMQCTFFLECILLFNSVPWQHQGLSQGQIEFTVFILTFIAMCLWAWPTVRVLSFLMSMPFYPPGLKSNRGILRYVDVGFRYFSGSPLKSWSLIGTKLGSKMQWGFL